MHTGPARIALTEFDHSGASTAHYADKAALVKGLMNHRGYWAEIKRQYAEAEAMWTQEAVHDAMKAFERMHDE